jgi:hypothetical protein
MALALHEQPRAAIHFALKILGVRRRPQPIRSVDRSKSTQDANPVTVSLDPTATGELF